MHKIANTRHPFFLPRLVGHLEYGMDIVFDRHFAKNRSLLCQITDTEAGALVDGITGDLRIVQKDFALIGSDQ